MPFHDSAAKLIRANLEQFGPEKKTRVKAIMTGTLTDRQLAILNAYQDSEHLPKSTGEVLCHGCTSTGAASSAMDTRLKM